MPCSKMNYPFSPPACTALWPVPSGGGPSQSPGVPEALSPVPSGCILPDPAGCSGDDG